MGGSVPDKLIIDVMQSVIKRTQAYFEGSFGISVDTMETSHISPESFPLLDMTVLMGFNGGVNLMVVFSFENALIDILYERMTQDLDIPDDETPFYREAAGGEIVNTILGHCTIDLQNLDRRGISLTPPSILDQAKSIRRTKNALLYTEHLQTLHGFLNIGLVGKNAS